MIDRFLFRLILPYLVLVLSCPVLFHFVFASSTFDLGRRRRRRRRQKNQFERVSYQLNLSICLSILAGDRGGQADSGMQGAKRKDELRAVVSGREMERDSCVTQTFVEVFERFLGATITLSLLS